MNKRILSGLTVAALCGTYSAYAVSQGAATSTSATKMTADAQTTRVVGAANAFLGTLTAAQKKAVSFAYTDSAQRARWSNFPTGIFQRAGVRYGDLSAAQRTALMNLLGTVLSPDGLTMVKQQMNADDVLKNTDGGGGGRLIFGSDEYYVSFLGTPSTTSPWTLQFGGHHLAINATVVGPNITLAPSLTGGQPIRATQNGKTVVVVQKVPQEVKDAYALLSSLNTTQRARAVVSTQRIDLVLGPGQDGKTLQPEGLPGSAMTAAQKAQLLTLIKDRLGILNADDAAPKLAAVQKNLDQTYFAWYGPTTAEGAANAYYRVTGPTVLIEFSPQSMGGDPSNHLHNMYREPGNDYGAALTK
ncbi:hypothetical protein DAETH_32550 (plasmid) [Deinococcus aetherius]|uniref:DUF3500 domain-containing protein n=1 Tax=Deinococcus aetherius TaxID=200252 RepID=A0ABM8AHQ4_9DEIO|nr:DUF3500 domain-containing protein [Deinococcus aetherius]BDP43286.1 hypothetical protein DAETH_32550 [Deinococcus aetherius]